MTRDTAAATDWESPPPEPDLPLCERLGRGGARPPDARGLRHRLRDEAGDAPAVMLQWNGGTFTDILGSRTSSPRRVGRCLRSGRPIALAPARPRRARASRWSRNERWRQLPRKSRDGERPRRSSPVSGELAHPYPGGPSWPPRDNSAPPGETSRRPPLRRDESARSRIFRRGRAPRSARKAPRPHDEGALAIVAPTRLEPLANLLVPRPQATRKSCRR
jgi:hypothetical protein